VVLVVDDVVTTGATLRTAAEALLAAGVSRVELAAAASTQLRQSEPTMVCQGQRNPRR